MKRSSPSEDDLDNIFFALSDKTRRGILQEVSGKDASVTELADLYGISLPGIMKHLKVLDRADLVSLSKEGRVRKCNFDPKGLQQAQNFIDEYREFWEGQFDKIENFLKKQKNK